MPDNEMTLLVNDTTVTTNANPAMVVLDFLRRDQRLVGTKEGCREGDCGACTVLIGELEGRTVRYRAVNSCLLPLGDAAGCHVVTIEGLNPPAGLNEFQQAFVDAGATQCGFCTPGFLVSLTGSALAARPTLDDALAALDGNICRCTGHPPIHTAVRAIVDGLADLPETPTCQDLVERGIVPAWFAGVPERLAAFEPMPSAAGEGTILAGGTDLYVQQAFTMVDAPGTRIQRSRAEIAWDGDDLHVPATTTVADFAASADVRAIVPGIGEIARLFGSTPIRNRATLGGNLVNASPIGDMTSLLLALGATLVLRAGDVERRVEIEDFHLAYRQVDLAPRELVEGIVLRRTDRVVSFEKVSRRRVLDIASVNTTMAARIEGATLTDVRVSMGGVAATPLLLRATSQALHGPIDAERLAEAGSALADEIAPISDARGSALYKRLLAHQLLLAHLDTLVPDALHSMRS